MGWAQTQKRIFQEAGSRCPFCGESDVATLQVHHIVPKEEGGGDQDENLILSCSNCHAKVGRGIISRADVMARKRELASAGPPTLPPGQTPPGSILTIHGDVSRSIVGNTVKVSGPRKPKMNYPAGSVVEDLMRRNYIAYLVGRYHEFRKADASFGRANRGRPFSHAEIHTSIRRKFKADTYFVLVERFPEEATFIKGRIDQTILGKRNKARGTPNYRSFEDFVKEQQGLTELAGGEDA